MTPYSYHDKPVMFDWKRHEEEMKQRKAHNKLEEKKKQLRKARKKANKHRKRMEKR